MKTVVKALIAFAFLFSAAVFAAPVNINTADAASIATSIKGVGLKKAEAIVAYRKTHGPFNSVDDLAAVQGIGKATVEKNRSNITVK